ncbi:hypothetical protein C5S53_12755 [Methanophagales archaeon]|nr:hypothetical protein C5S53_12755 [Methanophagales archaeon]
MLSITLKRQKKASKYVYEPLRKCCDFLETAPPPVQTLLNPYMELLEQIRTGSPSF